MENTSALQDDTLCLNCGTELRGNFCSNCGQKFLPKRQGITDIVINFIGSFTSFESKFFRTLSLLTFRPGRMINDYLIGRRERYYHPARMYVFLSFILFLIASIKPDDTFQVISNGKVLEGKEKEQVLDTLNWARIGPQTVEEYDSMQNAKPPNERDGKILRFFSKRGIEITQRYEKDNKRIMKTFVESFRANIPKMIFLLLPIFALLLKLLYLRHDFFYSEHLVFAVFFYDFLFLAGIVALLFSLVSWLSWLRFLVYIFVLFYLYKAMKNVYNQSRIKTALKYFTLIISFVICLILALSLNFFVTLSIM
jgi:hypothetical protein